MYDRHIAPRLGDVPLREIDPETVAAFQGDLLRGGVGPQAIRKSMTVRLLLALPADLALWRSACGDVLDGLPCGVPVLYLRSRRRRQCRGAIPVAVECPEQDSNLRPTP